MNDLERQRLKRLVSAEQKRRRDLDVKIMRYYVGAAHAHDTCGMIANNFGAQPYKKRPPRTFGLHAKREVA